MGKYWGLAFKMIAVIMLLTYAGVWLDEQVEIKFPVFTVVLALAGSALAIYILIIDTKPRK